MRQGYKFHTPFKKKKKKKALKEPKANGLHLRFRMSR